MCIALNRPRAALRQCGLDAHTHSGKGGQSCQPFATCVGVWADELPQLVVQPFDLEGVVGVEHDPGAVQC